MFVSIVMTMRNRAALLERSLQALGCWSSFSARSAELVVVDDRSDDSAKLEEVLERYSPFFRRVQLVTMDRQFSTIPIAHNNPALGINLAVKEARGDIVFKVDPECLPLDDIVTNSLALFDPNAVYFASVRLLTAKETEVFDLTSLGQEHPETIYRRRLVQLPDLWYIRARGEAGHQPYYYGALFSRQKFMDIGGVDEQFLSGFAGEDDDWAHRMQRSGVQWSWSDKLRVLHQFHGAFNRRYHHSPEHYHNIRLLERNDNAGLIVANNGHDWGSERAVVARKTLWED